MNQYDKFYSTRTVCELLEQLYGHKAEVHPLDKSWVDAMITYLSSLQLEEKEQALFREILSSDAKLLNNNRVSIRKRLDELKAHEEYTNPLVIDPARIAEAGLTLKYLVILIIVLLSLFALALVLLATSRGYGDKVTAYYMFFWGGLIGSSIALALLYRAGHKLSSSVSRQRRQ